MPNRNNTNFGEEVLQFLRSVKQESGDPLKYYQRIIHDYFIKFGIRGMLIYHEMGTGKTYLAASIARTLATHSVIRRILFISNKTLQSNFVRTYERMYNELDPKIKLITLTANNMAEQVDVGSGMTKEMRQALEESESALNLDGCVVIVDEAHRFFNGICNGSENYTKLYDAILRARNIRVLFLSGTPIMSHPFELAVAFNMLAGLITVATGSGRSEHFTLFGENFGEFDNFFIKQRKLDKFANRIVGLVSYYGISGDLAKLFPRIKDVVNVRCRMSEYQFSQYKLAEEKELPGNTFPIKPVRLQKPKSSSGNYRTRTRQFGNIVYPREFYHAITGKSDELIVDETRTTGMYDQIGNYSAKFVKLLANIARHIPFELLDKTKIWDFVRRPDPEEQGPGIVYSQFIEYGIGRFAKFLEYLGFRNVIGSPESDAPAYGIISGEVDPETREKLVAITTSPDNKRCKRLSLFLITMTGSEGISTKYMKHVHILEPYWLPSIMSQIIYRAARLDSHRDLPEDERVVVPYVYFAECLDGGNSSDDIIYGEGLSASVINETFLDILKRCSIDCMLNYKNCRLCKPTNQKLFLEDIQRDMQWHNPCEYDKKIVANKIVHDGRTYMYAENDIYEFNQEQDGYVKLDPGSDEYLAIAQLISSGAGVTGGSDIVDCYELRDFLV